MGTERNKQLRPGTSSDAPGRIAVDSRGRNIWQWNDDQLDSTTIMLQRLDNSALALEPTRNLERPDINSATMPKQGAAKPQQGAGRSTSSASRSRSTASGSESLRIEQTFNVKLGSGGGFDPYNRS